MKKALQVDKLDNLGVVTEVVGQGDKVQTAAGIVTACEDIPLGHKISLCDIPAGELVLKYGVPIGKAAVDIPAGSHAHTHNILDITEELCQHYVAECRKGVVS